MPRTAALFTYPWDLADEGVDRAAARIKELTGIREVQLATSYHISTYFLPHNPKRKVYFGEDGMALWKPEAKRYEKLSLKPRVSELVTGDDYYGDLVRGIRKGGLDYGAWMVYCYNHHLARTRPDCARADVFGNANRAQLCPGNPAVRDYARVMTEEVLDRFKPSTVFLESLGYLPFSYGFLNPKVFVEITPRDQFLLGLCFCSHCVRAAAKTGMAAAAFKDELAHDLSDRLARNPKPEEKGPVSEAWLSEALDGRLAHYLAARTASATSLYEELAALCHARGARTMDFLPGNEPVSGQNADRVARAGDQFCIDGSHNGTELNKRWPNKEFLYSAQPADMTPELKARCAAAIASGAHGFTFYNYGLVRDENLRHIGAARDLWA